MNTGGDPSTATKSAAKQVAKSECSPKFQTLIMYVSQPVEKSIRTAPTQTLTQNPGSDAPAKPRNSSSLSQPRLSRHRIHDILPMAWLETCLHTLS